MSEAQSRPVASRGRGSGRGGRGGGFATRGGVRAGTRTNGDSKHDTETTLPALEDEGEIGQLKKQYGGKVAGIKEMFPDWSEIDILYALQETEGDENLAGDRIAEGKLTSLDAHSPSIASLAPAPAPCIAPMAHRVLQHPNPEAQQSTLTCPFLR